MIRIAWFDTLEFQPRSTGVQGRDLHGESALSEAATGENPGLISLRVIDASDRRLGLPVTAGDVPTDDRNLVVKAAKLLNGWAGTHHQADILLTKRIPSAAGLAGGSSDAAATLFALNRLWGLNFPQSALIRIAAELGSDIGFFLGETSVAVCRGRGEIVEPARIAQPLHFVVIKPPSGLSTPAVYKHCQPSETGLRVADFAKELERGRLLHAARTLNNDLQPPAERLSDDVVRLKAAFSKLPVLGHQMSGSGSAYFGWCRSAADAAAVAGKLRQWNLGTVRAVHSVL